MIPSVPSLSSLKETLGKATPSSFSSSFSSPTAEEVGKEGKTTSGWKFPTPSSSSLESLHQEMGKKLSEKATAAKKESEEFLQATTESLKKRVTEAEATLPSFMTGSSKKETVVDDKKEKDSTENSNDKWFGNNWKNPFQKKE
jgi:hypothetical protein